MNPLDTAQWYNCSGVPVEDMRTKIKEYGADKKYTLHIGTDVLERLLHEAVISLEVANSVKEHTNLIPTIHADINSKESALSNRVADAIMGMIKGMGYPVLIKPDAWAADIADMYTR